MVEENNTFLRIWKQDKDFYIKNGKLETYLSLKHKIVIRRQEDLLMAVRMELEEALLIDGETSENEK